MRGIGATEGRDESFPSVFLEKQSDFFQLASTIGLIGQLTKSMKTAFAFTVD